jgi:hypothetical protein
MCPQALTFALTLIAASMWLPSHAATAGSRQGQSRWLRIESSHFEIHYLPTLARDVERVVRSAERAYDRISARLDFVFARKVPLIMSASTGPLTRDEIVAYAVSDEVAPSGRTAAASCFQCPNAIPNSMR